MHLLSKQLITQSDLDLRKRALSTIQTELKTTSFIVWTVCKTYIGPLDTAVNKVDKVPPLMEVSNSRNFGFAKEQKQKGRKTREGCKLACVQKLSTSHLHFRNTALITLEKNESQFLILLEKHIQIFPPKRRNILGTI